ncbi:calcitonin gene-related peptide type 1 receptor-like isoform X2 [Centruroides vittatus]|uniref:calcitonin gene-related peptide type 1 receptor-like isoform X2 n=1 Tax=Centruroides vittatus TaxID=120091 RepID=UPI00350F0416
MVKYIQWREILILLQFLNVFYIIQASQINIEKFENNHIRHENHKVRQKVLLNQLKMYWKCRRNAINLPSDVEGDDAFCPSTFDGWICWNATRARVQATAQCPSTDDDDDDDDDDDTRIALKNCLPSGKWEKNQNGEDATNYEACNIKHLSPETKRRLYELITNFASLDESPYDDPKILNVYEKCVENLVTRTSTIPGTYCPGTFDGWSCWNDTPAGEVTYAICPKFIPGFLPDRFAFKVCNVDGTWFRHPETNKTWSNYTTCIDHEDLMFRQKINNLYIAGYSISLIALIVSLAVFFYFRSLRCIRITIHKNLFFSFIMNNIMWIIWYTEVVQHVDIVVGNSPGCQILHLLVHYFLLCNYFWMFCEGLHLHTLMIFTFVEEKMMLKIFFLIGWALPLLLITIYGCVRMSIPKLTVYCWIEETNLQWIISGPVCLSMMLNVIFLINIVRVLITKLRAINSPETHQTKKAVRATLILLPLLGLHYLVTPFRPQPGTSGEAVYEIVAAIVTSFQGLCVASLFCFFNGEVLAVWRKKWMRNKLNRGKDQRISYAATTLSEVTAV